MICSVNGCDVSAMYKEKQLCQKHYFRLMRNGTTDLVRKRRYRMSNPAGYQLVYEPDHELSQKGGYVYEHRYVLFNMFGHSIKLCSLCKKKWRWDDIYNSHVDHIDNDITNNNVENLRALCNSCNVKRTEKPRFLSKGREKITFKGLTMTPEEWSRQPGVTVSGSTIRRRYSAGLSAKDAICTPSKTFKGSKNNTLRSNN